ncbi:uncharacterized protein LOC128982619, partial [Macrosteles quadrilineatus]|uniref:uncharacterized protein LOC128982619 n=1 Tax=Macrosteles quadrilineatus TaxID=74068 RepID=UPI0023E3086E
MIISAEFKQRCRSVIELLAKELIDRATDELMSYFEGELTRHCLNLKPLDLSVNSDTEVDRLTKPVDLSVSCGNFVATLDKIVDQKTSEPIFPIKQEQLDQVVNLPNSVADEKKTETQKENETNSTESNVSLKRNAESTTTNKDNNKSDTPPAKKPKTEISTKPISKTNSTSSALTKSSGPSKASSSINSLSSSKSEESSHDDDDHYEYDRWSTSNFHRIKVIEIQCYVKNCQVMCKSKAEHEKHLQIDHKNSFLPFNCLAEGCSKSFADKQRCRNVIERLAKEMIDQATVQLTAYFEVELARQLNLIDASAHRCDSEGGDQHETPIDLSVGGGRQVVIKNQVSAADLPSAPNCKQEPEEQSDHQEDDAAASSVNTTDQTRTSALTNNDPSDNDPSDSDKYEELSSGDLENELYEQSDFEETEVAPSFSENDEQGSVSDEQPVSNAEDNAVQQEEVVSTGQKINLKRAVVAVSNTESESDNESDTPLTKKPKTAIAAKPTSAISTSSSTQPKRACPSKTASSSTEVHSSSNKSDATGNESGSETDTPPAKKPKIEAIATKPISKQTHQLQLPLQLLS